MLDVIGLTKDYGSKVALQGVEFRVTKGKIMGLLGPNGAGKTTTMRIMTGFLEPSQGDVLFNGTSILQYPRDVKRKLGYLPEHAPLYQEFLVSEYLRFIAEAREIEMPKRNEAIDRVVQLCSLNTHFYHPIFQLSKGFRQRVALAGTLIHDPDYIILDEPSTGLDPNQITEIRSLIRKLGKEKILILSTHILQEVVEVCDQVVILSKGKKVLDRGVEELRKNHLVYFTTKANEEELNPVFSRFKFQGLERQGDIQEGWISYVVDSRERGSSSVFQALVEVGSEVREIRPYQKSMESIFSELTLGGRP